MRDNVIKIVIFTAGAAIGSAVTYKLIKTKYETIANDEIEEIREYYKSKEEDTEGEPEQETAIAENVKVESKPNVVNYAAMVNNMGYDTSDKAEDRPVEEDDAELPYEIAPYEIAPDEYSEFEDYSYFSFTYYDDGFVADDNDELVEDVDDIIGNDLLERFKEDPDLDSIYVRNDALKSDYEILRDYENYTDLFEEE